MANAPSMENGQAYPSIVSSLEDLIRINASSSTIYADQPLDYRNHSSRGAAANHYQTLSVGKICKLPVAELACEDGHLYLWTPDGVRQLVESVSPGPYIELFGRIEIPNSFWMVFGNEVERMLY